VEEHKSMTSQPYPILKERTLGPVRRRWLLGGRRDPAELPEQPPGTVLVFEANGAYRAFHERRHLTGAEELVIDAVSVSVVDVRRRDVVVDLEIASASPANDFLIRASFRCTVTRPEAIVAARLADVSKVLRDYLCGDAELTTLGMERSVEAINEVRRHVAARLDSYVAVVPPEIDGMNVELSAVQVLTPPRLRDHATELQGEKWREEIEELRQAFEGADVERISEILQDQLKTVALGISRHQVHIGEVMNRQEALADRKMEYLLRMIEAMPAGALDFLPVDTKRLLDTLTRHVVGPDQSLHGELPSANSPNGDVKIRPSLPELGRGRDVERPRPLDEESLDD
jgi:hypothetical protein